MRTPRPLIGLLVAIVALLNVFGGSAQDESPGPDPNAPTGDRAAPAGARLDLAAMSLPSEALPEGYQLSYEVYVAGDELTARLAGGDESDREIERMDLRWYYLSQYEATDGQSRIRVYLEEFGSAGGARQGFAILEDEERYGGEGASFVDKPGFDIGEEPGEVTVSTVEAGETSPSAATVDATFRVDRLLGGVALDTIGTTAPDEALLEELATQLESRIRAVVDGDDLPGIDPALPGQVLPFDAAVDVREGYVTAVDSLGAEPPQAAIEGYESGYLRTVGLGDESASELPLPFVTIAVSSYTSEGGPLAVLGEAETLSPQFMDLAPERLDRIEGATAAVAFSFANPASEGGPDSFRVLVVVDTNLVTVDVQGAASVDAARETALSLVDQQIACLAADGACEPASLPEGDAERGGVGRMQRSDRWAIVPTHGHSASAARGAKPPR